MGANKRLRQAIRSDKRLVRAIVDAQKAPIAEVGEEQFMENLDAWWAANSPAERAEVLAHA